jgi:hypothetical protein
MKKLLLLFCFSIFKLSAQNCSVQLVSPDEDFSFCGATLEPMTPIVYTVEGDNIYVEGLPPGITATQIGNQITISGTPEQAGYWYYRVHAGDCQWFPGYIGYSLTSGFPIFCSAVTENSITVSFPNVPQETDGTFFLFWQYEEITGSYILFMPEPADSYTIPNLPPGTDVLINAHISGGMPICTQEGVSFTCTTATLGTAENAKENFYFAPNPVKDFLEISAGTKIESVVFYDLLGREVIRETVGTDSGKVSFSKLASGTYVMQVSADGKQSAYKIVKQ